MFFEKLGLCYKLRRHAKGTSDHSAHNVKQANNVIFGILNALSTFEALDENRTRWTMESEFRCSGMLWLLAKLMPGMFKKQTLATMKAFKAFADKQDA